MRRGRGAVHGARHRKVHRWRVVYYVTDVMRGDRIAIGALVETDYGVLGMALAEPPCRLCADAVALLTILRCKRALRTAGSLTLDCSPQMEHGPLQDGAGVTVARIESALGSMLIGPPTFGATLADARWDRAICDLRGRLERELGRALRDDCARVVRARGDG